MCRSIGSLEASKSPPRMTPSPHPHIDEAYKPRPRRLFLLSHSVAKVNSLPLNIFKFKYITLVYSWKDFTLAAQITRLSQARFKFPTSRARKTVQCPWVAQGRGVVKASN